MAQYLRKAPAQTLTASQNVRRILDPQGSFTKPFLNKGLGALTGAANLKPKTLPPCWRSALVLCPATSYESHSGAPAPPRSCELRHQGGILSLKGPCSISVLGSEYGIKTSCSSPVKEVAANPKRPSCKSLMGSNLIPMTVLGSLSPFSLGSVGL